MSLTYECRVYIMYPAAIDMDQPIDTSDRKKPNRNPSTSLKLGKTSWYSTFSLSFTLYNLPFLRLSPSISKSGAKIHQKSSVCSSTKCTKSSDFTQIEFASPKFLIFENNWFFLCCNLRLDTWVHPWQWFLKSI